MVHQAPTRGKTTQLCPSTQLLIAGVVCLLSPAVAAAEVRLAASCNQVDVQAAVDGAAAGDTVVVPAS